MPLESGQALNRLWRPQTLLLFLFVLVLLAVSLTGCSRANDEPIPRQDFWPATDRAIALVSKGGDLFITDGIDIQATGIPAGSDNGTDPLPIQGSGQWLALMIDDRVYVLDLSTGQSQWRSCRSCSGVSLANERLTTVLDDGRLIVFDTNLKIVDTTQLQGQIGQSSPRSRVFEDPYWQPEYAVAGVVAERLVVASLPRWGVVRGGPTLLSELDSEGRVAPEHEVDGRFGQSVPRPDGQELAIGLWSSSGACSSGQKISTIDSASQTHQVTSTDAQTAEGDANIVTDWSWNGDRLLMVGYVIEWGVDGGVGCRTAGWRVRQVQSDGSTPTTWASPGLESLRVLDACDRVLAIQEQPGQGRRLVGADGSGTVDLGQFDAIEWSTPASTPCANLAPVLEGLNGG